MTEPEQWAVELLEAVHDASDMGSACGMVDCQQCKAAALTIQRAFEERERKLREAGTALLAHIGPRDSRVYRTDPAVRRFEAALATRQDAPKSCSEDTSHDQ